MKKRTGINFFLSDIFLVILPAHLHWAACLYFISGKLTDCLNKYFKKTTTRTPRNLPSHDLTFTFLKKIGMKDKFIYYFI